MNDAMFDFENANPDPRVACVLLLDTSGSMQGSPITQLNKGIDLLEQSLKQNELTKMRAEVAIVTFSSHITVAQEFVTADSFFAPTLQASGGTSMGAGIEKALSLLKDRKRYYKDNNINSYKPFFFVITDGVPYDQWTGSAQKLAQYEENGGANIFPIGVEGADFSVLEKLSNKRPPMKLNGLAFEEFFEWVSDSLSIVSNSSIGDQVRMPETSGWESISV